MISNVTYVSVLDVLDLGLSIVVDFLENLPQVKDMVSQ